MAALSCPGLAAGTSSVAAAVVGAGAIVGAGVASITGSSFFALLLLSSSSKPPLSYMYMKTRWSWIAHTHCKLCWNCVHYSTWQKLPFTLRLTFLFLGLSCFWKLWKSSKTPYSLSVNFPTFRSSKYFPILPTFEHNMNMKKQLQHPKGNHEKFIQVTQTYTKHLLPTGISKGLEQSRIGW